MLQESYRLVKVPDENYYEFVSVGSKGNIKKVIMYDLIYPQKRLYNLGFGDVDHITGEVDDMSVSNNGDMEKVLTTVGKSLIDFMERHPYAMVNIQGSTAYRTRLYQMNISKFYDQIKLMFKVQGYYNERWEPFEKGKNYSAFLVTLNNLSNFTLST